MAGSRRAARVGSAVSGSSAGIAFLVAIVTNYVTAQPPKWAENTILVWSVFGVLAVVSLGLFFWERRRGAGRWCAACAARADRRRRALDEPAYGPGPGAGA
ncbi:hypothetical protein [Streptomyces rubiginosohelvolus]|uniref:hypothetical protein n=1 Tax=Streptomyces rubiginosohelvolus TaxID=67362 RepID=UPI00382023E4